jgi:hypothetical protein
MQLNIMSVRIFYALIHLFFDTTMLHSALNIYRINPMVERMVDNTVKAIKQLRPPRPALKWGVLLFVEKIL